MVFNMCFSKPVGNPLTHSTSEEKRRNLEIERMIRKDKKLQARQVKILLLGLFSGVVGGLYLIRRSYRCWGVGKINHLEADADHILGGLPYRRAKGNPSSDLLKPDCRL